MPLWARIIICIVVVEVLGTASGLLTVSQIPTWYATLERPPGNPPNWVFGPVWAVLYGVMGAAFALVWHRVEAGPVRLSAMKWFGLQFALNLAWTPLFFGAHWMAVALVVIVALAVAIGFTIAHFRRVSPLAAGFLVPYLCWVCYASYLNAGYFVLNR